MTNWLSLTVSDVDIVASFISDVGLKLVDEIRSNMETIKCAIISTEYEAHAVQEKRHVI